MAGFSIKVEAVELERALKRSVSSCHHFGAVGRQIGEHMLGSVLKNFEAGGRPDKWQALSQRTLVGRAGGAGKAFTKKGKPTARFNRTVEGHKILIDSGRLRNSITYKVGTNEVQIGTNLVYAAAQQFGRTDKKRGSPLPARPYLAVQGEDERVIAQLLELHVIGVMM